jgi:hypothetical protein
MAGVSDGNVFVSSGSIIPVVNSSDILSAREIRAALGSRLGVSPRIETVQRWVLFMDGHLAGERRTVPVDENGMWRGFIESSCREASAYWQVEYRVEEVQLGFGDTVFLGFTPADERPSWPQRVEDALAFIEAETAAFLERERQRRCRHLRKRKVEEPTVEDPHRYRTVCKDCGWSVLFEGPDTCAFCRNEPLPWPHPDRPNTGWMFCEHCGNQHEVSRREQV